MEAFYNFSVLKKNTVKMISPKCDPLKASTFYVGASSGFGLSV
jgi:hypothetical protein